MKSIICRLRKEKTRYLQRMNSWVISSHVHTDIQIEVVLRLSCRRVGSAPYKQRRFKVEKIHDVPLTTSCS